MNDSTKTRRTGGTQLPESGLRALNTILERCRAHYQFQGNLNKYFHIRDKERQNVSTQGSSEIETSTRLWLDAIGFAETAGAIEPSRCFLMRVFAIERLCDWRWFDGLYSELEDISTRIDAIQRREGLDDNEYWHIGQGPEDWQELNRQYSQVLDAKFEEALREFGLDNIADLYGMDRISYDAHREQGRRLVFEGIPELERLSTVKNQFEGEAVICARGGAYHAAVVMIGAAMEATLLLACMSRREEALNARDRLPVDKRPDRANPRRWTLHELVFVADEAGWLPDFDVPDGTLHSPPLFDMMRKLRNLVHPNCHLSDSRIANVENEYASAQAAYTLLEWHLARLP